MRNPNKFTPAHNLPDEALQRMQRDIFLTTTCNTLSTIFFAGLVGKKLMRESQEDRSLRNLISLFSIASYALKHLDQLPLFFIGSCFIIRLYLEVRGSLTITLLLCGSTWRSYFMRVP